MKPHASNTERARSIIDRLSDRIDAQAMQPGADAPHCVAVVGAFHTLAGLLERRIEERPHWFITAAETAVAVRPLRRIARAHACMVAMRAIALRNRAR